MTTNVNNQPKIRFLKPNCFIAFYRDDEVAKVLTQDDLQRHIQNSKNNVDFLNTKEEHANLVEKFANNT